MVYSLSFRVVYFDLFHLFQRFRLAPQPGNATIMPRQFHGAQGGIENNCKAFYQKIPVV